MEERYAFVLRIWLHRPASPQQPEQLRGTLESVGSDGPRYFTSLAQLTELLAATMVTSPRDLSNSGLDPDRPRDDSLEYKYD